MALPNPRFDESYARIFGEAVAMDAGTNDFFKTFYDNFLKDPDVAELFADTDLPRQIGMLKKSFFQLVSYYAVGQPTAELDRLAMVHARLSIPEDMFDVWMQALLDTVAQYDDEFEETTGLAWAWALAPGIAYMRLKLGEPATPTTPTTTT